MSESVVRRVAADALVPGHPTPGLTREQAFVLDDLWSGRVRTEAGVSSGWHHHGDHDTVIYVVRGALTVETTNGVTRGDPGDFLHVPAHTVHRESNPTGQTSELVLIRRGSGPLVVNVEGPPG